MAIARSGLSGRIEWRTADRPGKSSFSEHARTPVGLIRGFDLYVSTSRWEGLPLVLLEVMEQGVPIVASDVVGNRDVLKGWGYLFPAHDVAGTAAAQIRLAMDASLRADLAATGRDVRRKRFMVSRMLNELDSAYREYLVYGLPVEPDGDRDLLPP